MSSIADTSAQAIVGIVVNPRSGADVRRVVAAAAATTLEEKISVVRRLVLGAVEGGVRHFVLNHDSHQIARRATETFRDLRFEIVNRDLLFDERDTARAVSAMRERGCGAVAILGGDGTNRAAARTWRDIPVVPLSTGTNNAFPVYVEPTVAGTAAGLVASGRVALDEVARRAKVVRVRHGAEEDLALIDAVGVDDPIVGSLELFRAATMVAGVLTRADPAAIGFSAVGAMVDPFDEASDHGLFLRFSAPDGALLAVRAPTAPGYFDTVGIAEHRRLALDESVEIAGPLILELDGERKRRIRRGDVAALRVCRDGPNVIDVAAVMRLAADRGLMRC